MNAVIRRVTSEHGALMGLWRRGLFDLLESADTGPRLAGADARGHWALRPVEPDGREVRRAPGDRTPEGDVRA